VARGRIETGCSRNAVRVAVFRMRRRYGDLLGAQMADTVTSPEEAPAELDHLFSLLRS
jgi:hypothetical protein